MKWQPEFEGKSWRRKKKQTNRKLRTHSAIGTEVTEIGDRGWNCNETHHTPCPPQNLEFNKNIG